MYLQGNLQKVFDALYHLGVIDPVLEMDWSNALDELPAHFDEFMEVVQATNHHNGDFESLMSELKKFNNSALNYLAMEVAREFADFHARDTLH